MFLLLLLLTSYLSLSEMETIDTESEEHLMTIIQSSVFLYSICPEAMTKRTGLNVLQGPQQGLFMA